MIFNDRQDAGRRLAEKLVKNKTKTSVVYGLPRGGVITAKEIAKALNLPLDLIIGRKIGHPLNPEYAIGAISENGEIVGSAELAEVDPEWLKQKRGEEMREAKRRHDFYLIGREPIKAKGKIAIIVDDGIATGWTMLAAVKQVKSQIPRKIIVAVPVASSEAVERLKKEADEVVVLEPPETFLDAVGAYYSDFHQVSDEEVLKTLLDQ